MPEPATISLKEWWKYECNIVKQVFSEIKWPVFIRGGTSAIITGIAGYYGAVMFGFFTKSEISGRLTVAICAAILGTCLTFAGEFFFRLLRAPVKMDKEVREKLTEMENERNRALEIANGRFDKEESEHTKTVLFKAVKDQLGLYLRTIEHEILHVELMNWITATQADREKEILYWSDVKRAIANFLEEKISDAEAAKFESSVGMQQTPINGDDELTWPQKQRQLFLVQMTHNAKQLLSIIENLTN